MKVTGQAAQRLIAAEIGKHDDAIYQALAPWEPLSAVLHWFDTFRAIEGFINFPIFSIDDDDLARKIHELPLHAVFTNALLELRDEIAACLSENAARRFVMTMHQARALGASYAAHGIDDAAMLVNVAGTMQYFQSRQRHLVAMLYTLPSACRGVERIERMDTLSVFAPWSNYTAYRSRACRIRPCNVHGAWANHSFEPLDSWFLEPERASIVEMIEDGAAAPADLEEQDPQLVFSAAECRNDIRMLKAAYDEFGLAEGEFRRMASFFLRLLEHCTNDYFVALERPAFDALVKAAEQDGFRGREHVVANESGDYVQNTNEFVPIVRRGELYMTTVTLIARFLNYWKNVCLNKNRTFQVRSGFIFEESVRRKLTAQGFKVQDIRRIERKEFDVIALDGDVIYNIQCKNNLVDLRVESDRKRFARYNRYLDGYYAPG